MTEDPPVVHIGFTGTRHGMTAEQLNRIAVLLQHHGENGGAWFHHGDCVGADAEAHAIARRQGLRVHRHPPNVLALRAFCDFDVDEAPEEFLVRDRAIVHACTRLLAAPYTSRPPSSRRGSGTWYTIRYAVEHLLPVTVVLPDGVAVSGEAVLS